MRRGRKIVQEAGNAQCISVINLGRFHLYFLVQGASTAAVGAALPTPDASSTINLSGTSAITAGSASALSTVSGLVDFVGFGTTANAYEGSGAAPAPSNTTSVVRKTAGADTDDNAQDFTTQKPDPQNSASASAPVDSGKRDRNDDLLHFLTLLGFHAK